MTNIIRFPTASDTTPMVDILNQAFPIKTAPDHLGDLARECHKALQSNCQGDMTDLLLLLDNI